MSKTRQWAMLTAVACLAVLAAGWFLVVKPQRAHASDLRAQTTTVQPEPGTSTTVQSSPGSTTVQTQPQQPAPGTQVVVNPPADPPPPATTRVRTYDSPVVVEEHRRAVADQMGPNGARSPGGYALTYGGRF